MFGGLDRPGGPLGIIHVTDVYIVFWLAHLKFLVEPAPGYLNKRDEKSRLSDNKFNGFAG